MNAFTAQMRALSPAVDAASETSPASPPLVNAHIHLPPNFSAFSSVADALDTATAQHVGVLGASNYYDWTVYAGFAEGAGERGIFPIFGLEVICLLDDLVRAGIKINDPGNPGKMYLCGKGITGFAPLSDSGMGDEARGLLETIRKQDGERMTAVADRLRERFAEAGLSTDLNAERIAANVAARAGVARETVFLQERHLAQAFQEALFEAVGDPTSREAILQKAFGVAPKASPMDPSGVQNEIRSHLMKAGKPAFVPDTFVDFPHAYRLVLALGGVPSYPTLADGASPICPFEANVDELIAELKARNIPAAEFIPNRNDAGVLTRYVRAMRDAGLVVTAGTEHNTPDRIPLPPVCLDNQPIPDDIAAIFWEGACVLAAHQYRKLRGEPGFVNENGEPNPAYGSAEARIADFARLGETVIGAFCRKEKV